MIIVFRILFLYFIKKKIIFIGRLFLFFIVYEFLKFLGMFFVERLELDWFFVFLFYVWF